MHFKHHFFFLKCGTPPHVYHVAENKKIFKESMCVVCRYIYILIS